MYKIVLILNSAAKLIKCLFTWNSRSQTQKGLARRPNQQYTAAPAASSSSNRSAATSARPNAAAGMTSASVGQPAGLPSAPSATAYGGMDDMREPPPVNNNFNYYHNLFYINNSQILCHQ
jgi:hypothetical protein